ncbi:MAG: DnaD domain protein [Lachnospiraceae bacterium]|nr:DnaD domain protein [Lachnospiraceae bacterium]
MDQILLCTNHLPPVTTIYNSFIQNEMLDANGSYVKVYLYLSMCIQSGNTSFSISSLADQMENTENDIIRALNYWEKKELLVLQREETNGAITGIEFLVPEKQEKSTRPAVLPEKQNSQITTEAPKPSKAEKPSIHITAEQSFRLAENQDFIWISQIVENFLERPLKSTEIELLMYLYDNLHFSKELILYLYEYCCTLGKTHLKYVQAVAFSWAEQGISTPEQAKAASTAYSTVHTAVSKAFGLNRTLGAIEIQYINRWSNEWNFDLSAILEACNRTVLAIQKADFKYTDSILANWHENGVHTLQEIQIADESFAKKKASKSSAANGKQYQNPHSSTSSKNQFQAFQQRDVSAEEMKLLEKQLLSR